MSLGTHVIRPESIPSPSPEYMVGLYVGPFESDIRDQYNALQTTVNEIGFPIITIGSSSQTEPSPREWLAGFGRHDFLGKTLGELGFTGYTALGIGDYSGVTAVQHMQLQTLSTPGMLGFDALVLRNRWHATTRDRIMRRVSGQPVFNPEAVRKNAEMLAMESDVITHIVGMHVESTGYNQPFVEFTKYLRGYRSLRAQSKDIEDRQRTLLVTEAPNQRQDQLDPKLLARHILKTIELL